MVKDTTDFPEIVSWRQSAEYLAQYGHKGDIVAVSGSLQSREWTDKEGKKHKAWEVVTTSVELLSSKKESQGNNNITQPQNSYPGSYSQPQQSFSQPQYSQQGFGGYQQGGYPAQSYQPPFPQQGSFAPIEGDDEKLPF
jgi:single-strand DNA-binding protein